MGTRSGSPYTQALLLNTSCRQECRRGEVGRRDGQCGRIRREHGYHDSQALTGDGAVADQPDVPPLCPLLFACQQLSEGYKQLSGAEDAR